MLSNTAIIIIAVVIILCFLALYFFTYKTDVKIGKELEKKSVADTALQLQAYERLTILTERISLKNLLSKFVLLSITKCAGTAQYMFCVFKSGLKHLNIS